jgi:aspartate/methionine/tyrosine aminotransferase
MMPSTLPHAGLVGAGFRCAPPAGAYYILADFTGISEQRDDEFAKWLVREVGVASVPGSSFYGNPENGRSMVRFAFCKTEEMLAEAVGRLGNVRG